MKSSALLFFLLVLFAFSAMAGGWTANQQKALTYCTVLTGKVMGKDVVMPKEEDEFRHRIAGALAEQGAQGKAEIAECVKITQGEVSTEHLETKGQGFNAKPMEDFFNLIASSFICEAKGWDGAKCASMVKKVVEKSRSASKRVKLVALAPAASAAPAAE